MINMNIGMILFVSIKRNTFMLENCSFHILIPNYKIEMLIIIYDIFHLL